MVRKINLKVEVENFDYILDRLNIDIFMESIIRNMEWSFSCQAETYRLECFDFVNAEGFVGCSSKMYTVSLHGFEQEIE